MTVRATLRHCEPPWTGDCVAGVLESIRLGYAAQDVNTRPLGDLVPVAAHGGLLAKGSLENPWTGMPAGTKLEDLTVGQWLALGSPDGVHFPATIAQILAAVAGKDFTPCFDLKPSTGSHKVKPCTYIKAAAVLSGVPCLVMTEQWSKSASKTRAQKDDWLASAILRLAAAKQAGLPTMLLWRELLPVTHPVWGLVVAVKGAPAKQELPPHVIRVPNSSSATNARTVLAKVTATVDWTPEVPVVTPLRVDAIDLSHFNPVTLDDLVKAKAGGVKAVWHKATEATEFVDAFYAVRRRMAGTAGLPIGGYHFARPGASSGAVQAAHFLKTATPKPGDLRPMLDLEDRAGLSQAALTKWVGAFVAAMPVKPIIYTPFDLDDTFGCLLWVARYSNANAAPNIPKPWKSAAIRQFSNGVFGVPKSAPGVGHVDLNQLNVPLADLLIPAPEVPPVADDRYDRVTHGGKTLDKFTVQALQACEGALGYELTIVQGSYNKGVGASAGTHDGGGAVDLAPFDWANKVRVLRENGFAAWHRRPAQGPWNEHVHAILIGNDKASAGAKQQVVDYRNGLNGLANEGLDDGPRVLIHEFHYEEDDMPWTEKQLRTFMSEEAEKVVAKYVGDVVPAPTEADPKNTIWPATALGRLLKKAGA